MKRVIVTAFSSRATERIKLHFEYYVRAKFPAVAYIKNDDINRLYFSENEGAPFWEAEAFVFLLADSTKVECDTISEWLDSRISEVTKMEEDAIGSAVATAAAIGERMGYIRLKLFIENEGRSQ